MSASLKLNQSDDTSNRPSSMRSECGTLRDRWYVACTSDELAKTRPIGRIILDEHLVLLRRKDGTPICLLDRCIHRNAMLSEGRVRNDKLICPYHGWTYDSTGQCVDIPSHPEKKIPAKRCLESFPTLEQDGVVWVYMGDPDDIRCEPFRIPFFNSDGWRTYYMVTAFENNVTNCVENFMDVPHTAHVHAGWFRNTSNRPIRTDVERTADSVLVTYHQESDTIGFTDRLLNPSGAPMKHTDHFYMPNITRVDYTFGKRQFIITSQCTPVGPMKTMVYTTISYRCGPVHNGMLRFFLPWYTRKVIDQDVDILANQSRSLQRYGADYMQMPADVVHLYIESLREWAENGETGTAPAPIEREMTFHA